MDTPYKRLKYELIQSCLIPLRKKALGDKDEDTRSLFPQSPILFIMGSGRNGSTLLALQLSRHKDIYLPPEQYVLPYAIMSWHLNIFKSWEKFCRDTIRSFSTRNQHWKLGYEDFSEVVDELTGVKPEYRNFRNVFEAVFRHYARSRSGRNRIIGDHSPNVTLFYKTVYNEFPKARYVFLLRNPMDVIMSYRKLKGNPAADPLYAAWKWKNSVRAYDYIRKKSKSNVHLLKYEDLVDTPGRCLKRVEEFLDVPVVDLTKPFEGEAQADPLGARGINHHKHLYAPVSSRSVGRWKSEMDEDTYEKVLPILEDEASRFGYDLDKQHLDAES